MKPQATKLGTLKRTVKTTAPSAKVSVMSQPAPSQSPKKSVAVCYLRCCPETPPLPESQQRQTSLQKVNSLVFWFVYFLLIWQATCHLSDNGLAWLLRFLVSWLKVFGVEISNEFFEKLLLSFPGSLCLVRQFLNLDRDNFNKFVVCPKCTKLYKYDSCLEIENNQQVAKKCSNTYYSRGRKKTCNATMLTRVTLQNGKTCFYPIKFFCANSIIEELEKFLLHNNFASNCCGESGK